MPELGEVARIVHYLHKHLVGKTLAVVKAQHDENVFGKVGTSAAEFEKALTGKKVLNARQQGKYFWLEMSSPPHPVMHFGMAGWLKIRSENTAYFKSKPGDSDEWPPKYWKFILETAEEPKEQAAFVDFRRFARIRLVHCAAEELRQTSPLQENGPDPVIDKDVVTEEWLTEKLVSKKIPIKALLLDQANMSGIGNWVGDEIMYNARIHPEQYSNTLSTEQISQLHKSIHYVCGLAVETLADSTKFPEEWLFKHRWAKGKKDAPTTLPNGSKFVFLTVGGRTSAVVPSVQKKTGVVKKDIEVNGDVDDDETANDEKKSTATSKKSSKRKNDDDQEAAEKKAVAKKPKKGKSAVKEETYQEKAVNGTAREANDEGVKSESKKRSAKGRSEVNDDIVQTPKQKKSKTQKTPIKEEPAGRRRSGRVSGKGIS